MDPISTLNPENIWVYLAQIASQPGHSARVMTLASVDSTGLPQARSVILREVKPWLLRIYTDSRSPKVEQIQAKPDTQLVLWDAERRWQLRFSARGNILEDRAIVEALWQSIAQSRSAQDYLGAQPPGEIVQPGAAERLEPALAVLEFDVREVDWLALDPKGHKRQRLTPQGVQALVP